MSKSGNKKALRNKRRLELREVNVASWDEPPDGDISKDLDSSFKKNTAFIKKCRVSLNEANVESLLKDVKTLSLDKYVSEIITSFAEGLAKNTSISSADLFAGVEVGSALHQRFTSQFTVPLLICFLQGIYLPPKDVPAPSDPKEDVARNSRHKIVLRVLIEFWLVGMFRGLGDIAPHVQRGDIPSYIVKRCHRVDNPMPLAMAALDAVLDYDTEDEFSGHSMAVVLIKAYGSILTGIRRGSSGDDEAGLVYPTDQQRFLAVFTRYTKRMIGSLTKWVGTYKSQSRRNEDAFIRAGKVLDDRTMRTEALLARIDAVSTSCRTLCEFLGLEVPGFDTSAEEDPEKVQLKVAANFGTNSEIWDDDEQRKFYENVLDLSYVAETSDPSDSSERSDPSDPEASEARGGEGTDKDDKDDKGDKKNKSKEMRDVLKRESEILKLIKTSGSFESTGDEDDNDDIDDYESIIQNNETTKPLSEAGRKVQDFLLRLATASTREYVDSLAAEFVSLNNKATRNKLLLFYSGLNHRNAQGRLPFYCRFLATIHAFCQEVTDKVLAELSSFFYYLQRKHKRKKLYPHRIFNIRFFAELVKFGIVPNVIIFNKLEFLEYRLTSTNIELLGNVFESCGRYLLRKPASASRMLSLLESLEAKLSGSTKLSFSDRMRLKEALMYVQPPVQQITKVKHRSEIEQYIRLLMYQELGRHDDEILIKLRKLDWSDSETVRVLTNVFTKCWKLRFGTIETAAKFLAQLKPYHCGFVTLIIDSVFENIKVGLEFPQFRYNQRRIAVMKYLGDFARLSLIEPGLVFDTLFLIISFGHPNGQPRASGREVEADPRNDLFRIRLVCTVLETPEVAELLDKLDSAKLDLLLSFLQYYVNTKTTISMDVEFQIKDVYESIRPNWKLEENLEVSSEILKRAALIASGQLREPLFIGDESRRHLEMQTKLKEAQEQALMEERRRQQERLANKERIRAAKEDADAMDEVERELQLLMVNRMKESGTSDTIKRVERFDAVPVGTKGTRNLVQKPSDGKVGFSLLTKKTSSKENTPQVMIPSDSKLVGSVVEERMRRDSETEQVKNFILNYSPDGDRTQRIRKISQPDVQSTRYTRKIRTAQIEDSDSL